jgi:hypothetical protein
MRRAERTGDKSKRGSKRARSSEILKGDRDRESVVVERRKEGQTNRRTEKNTWWRR